MKINKSKKENWIAISVYAILIISYLIKNKFRFYLDENYLNTIVMIKDLQLSFFLIFISYKLYYRKKRKEELNKKLDIYKNRKIAYPKLFKSGARDYILEQRENDEKLSNNERELKKIEYENEFIDGSVLCLTIITCALQIISFYGHKI